MHEQKRTGLHHAVALGTLVVAMALGGSLPAIATTDWTQWGGPSRDFTVEVTGLADAWPEGGPEQVWSREIGEGYSGILAEGRALYTMYRDAMQEIIVALDARTGRTLWEYRYEASPIEGQTLRYGRGPNATPLIVGDVIYAVGFTAKMHALNKQSGELLWAHDLIEEFGGTAQYYGYAASPLAFSRMVVVLVGGERHGAIGFDLADGSVVWKAPPLDISYASPMAIRVGGEDQLAFMSPTEVLGVGLADGEVKWRWPHENQYGNNCAGPWWSEDGLLFVSSQGDAGSQTLQLKRSNGRTEVEKLNSDREMGVFHNSAIRIGDVIYGGNRTFYGAYDLKAGETLWKRHDLKEANTVHADGKMILFDENGKLVLATVSPEGMKVHSEVRLPGSRTWTPPTLTGTMLIVRGNGNLIAFELGTKPSKEPKSEPQALAGPYFGQEPPGLEPRIFAPEILSRTKPEWAFCAEFSPDHTEFYFSREDPDRLIDQIVWMRRTGEGWTEPEPVPFDSPYNSNDSRISHDGQRIYFRSRRPFPGDGTSKERLHLWSATRSADGWGEPSPVLFDGTPARTSHAGVAANGTLYFSYRAADNVGASDVHRSPLRNGSHVKPENLGAGINTRHSEGDIFVARDESFLIVSVWDHPANRGESDLYISFRQPDGSWSALKNLGPPINTEANENCAALSPDGKYFFYVAVRAHGDRPSVDTYWVDARILDSHRPAP